MVYTLWIFFVFYLLYLLFIIWTNFFYQNICFKLDTKLLWQRKLNFFKPWNHWIVARVIIIGKIIIIVYNQDNVDLYFRQVCCCALFYTIHIYEYTVKKNSKQFSLHKKEKKYSGYWINMEAHVCCHCQLLDLNIGNSEIVEDYFNNVS